MKKTIELIRDIWRRIPAAFQGLILWLVLVAGCTGLAGTLRLTVLTSSILLVVLAALGYAIGYLFSAIDGIKGFVDVDDEAEALPE